MILLKTMQNHLLGAMTLEQNKVQVINTVISKFKRIPHVSQVNMGLKRHYSYITASVFNNL